MSLFDPMSRIAPNLWMGSTPAEGAGHMHEQFKAMHFIVNLYPWADYPLLPHQVCTRAYLLDTDVIPDERLLFALANHINVCRNIGPVLVHCQVGMNRSGLLVALALMLEGKTSEEAVAMVRDQRDRSCLSNTTFERWLHRRAAILAVAPEALFVKPDGEVS